MKGDIESNMAYLRDNQKVKVFFVVFLALRIILKNPEGIERP